MSDVPPDPIRLSQAAMRRPAPKRVYTRVTVEASDGGFAVHLDGREARTPGGRPLVLPTQPAAEAVAEEWAVQGARIDVAMMPMTRLVHSTLDAVGLDPALVAAQVVTYARSDLICYRAGEPERLVAGQAAVWDPILAWADEAMGARFLLAQGIVFVEQPDTAIAAIEHTVAALSRPFALAAVNAMTTLAGSALIALAVAHGRLTVEEGWAAAHVDVDVQIEVWGEDAEAADRRARRYRDFAAAARLLHLLEA